MLLAYPLARRQEYRYVSTPRGSQRSTTYTPATRAGVLVKRVYNLRTALHLLDLDDAEELKAYLLR